MAATGSSRASRLSHIYMYICCWQLGIQLPKKAATMPLRVTCAREPAAIEVVELLHTSEALVYKLMEGGNSSDYCHMIFAVTAV